jgi:predicted Fe-S protein YdhL (DUF1289 family)
MPDVKEQLTPCIRVCRLEGAYCKGCGRHQDDIRMWSTYSNEQRKQIMKEISNGTYH